MQKKSLNCQAGDLLGNQTTVEMSLTDPYHHAVVFVVLWLYFSRSP